MKLIDLVFAPIAVCWGAMCLLVAKVGATRGMDTAHQHELIFTAWFSFIAAIGWPIGSWIYEAVKRRKSKRKNEN